MNYEKIYNALVEKAKVRGLDKGQHEGYFEIHHIIPRCLGGSDDKSNLVMFTGREHYLAHLILWKMYPKESGLFHAAWMMSNKRFTMHKSRLYESLKIEHAKILSSRSEFASPNFKDLTGLVSERLTVVEFAGWTQQARGKRTSLWSCLCECGESIVLKAKELSPKWAYKSCGCFKIDQQKAKVGEKNSFFGKKHSEESKAKMAAKKIGRPPSNKGQIRTEETRQRIIDALKLVKKYPWKSGTVLKSEDQVYKWLMADYYYDLFITNINITAAKFTTLYNKLHCDDVSANTFSSMHREFVKGWVPLEDEEWIKFSKGD